MSCRSYYVMKITLIQRKCFPHNFSKQTVLNWDLCFLPKFQLNSIQYLNYQGLGSQSFAGYDFEYENKIKFRNTILRKLSKIIRRLYELWYCTTQFLFYTLNYTIILIFYLCKSKRLFDRFYNDYCKRFIVVSMLLFCNMFTDLSLTIITYSFLGV